MLITFCGSKKGLTCAFGCPVPFLFPPRCVVWCVVYRVSCDLRGPYNLNAARAAAAVAAASAAAACIAGLAVLVLVAVRLLTSPAAVSTIGLTSATGIGTALPYRGTRRCVYLVRACELTAK